MNRREFLQSLLGAAAVAAMPAAALAQAELAAAPLADAITAWTPSDYFFSCYVKREKANVRTMILGVDGTALYTTRPQWERIGFRISQELGDALCGTSINTLAGNEVMRHLLRTIGQDKAEVSHVMLEIAPQSPQFSCCEFPHLPLDHDPYGFKRQNILTYSDGSFTAKVVR